MNILISCHLIFSFVDKYYCGQNVSPTFANLSFDAYGDPCCKLMLVDLDSGQSLLTTTYTPNTCNNTETRELKSSNVKVETTCERDDNTTCNITVNFNMDEHFDRTAFLYDCDCSRKHEICLKSE